MIKTCDKEKCCNHTYDFKTHCCIFEDISKCTYQRADKIRDLESENKALKSVIGKAIRAMKEIESKRNAYCQGEGCTCVFDTAHYFLKDYSSDYKCN